MYDSILARSFSKHEQRTFGYGAFVGCLLLALSFCAVFKPYLGPLPVLNLKLSTGVGLKMLMVKHTTTSHSDQLIRVIEAAIPAENDIEAAVPTKDDIRTVVVPEKDEMEAKIPAKEDNGTAMQPEKDDIEAEIPEKKYIEPHFPAKNDIELETQTKNDIKPEVPAKNDIKRAEIAVQKMELVCKTTEPKSDFCEINNGDIRINGNSSTVYIASSEIGNKSWIVKPYARKMDATAMSQVRQWTVKPVPRKHQEFPNCTVNHSVPAILFSLAGYAGNHFHAFTDVIVPLYLTSREFNGEVQFLVTNMKSDWIEKFRELLKSLSKYEIINIDEATDVHCFSHAIVGLKHHKEFGVDPAKSPHSMKDFRELLRSSYSLKKSTAIKIRDGETRKPRLLIISRKGTRSFTNGNRIVKMARRLGFQVVIAEADMKLSKFAEIVNSCDVLMGVHGAGLTNIVFLPENAVFIQVVPFGPMEWLANTFFEVPAKDMNLRYLEYKIGKQESTLIQQYPLDHAVLSDPNSIGKKGWDAFKSVYLEQQNVKLDVRRFRPTLLKALELLHQ